MSDSQRALLRAHAAKVAAEAPPLTEETRVRLAALLRPAVQTTSTDWHEPKRAA